MYVVFMLVRSAERLCSSPCNGNVCFTFYVSCFALHASRFLTSLVSLEATIRALHGSFVRLDGRVSCLVSRVSRCWAVVLLKLLI